MAIVALPAIIPTRSTWGLKSLTETFTSPLNGTVQTVGRPGARWKVTLEFNGMDLTQGATLEAWLASLDGMAGRCYLYPHHRPGTGAAATVNGAGQLGKSINLSCAPNRTFAAGDFFTVNNELKMVTAPATADGSGIVTLTFSPMLRTSPVSSSAVTFTKPQVLMMLAQDEYAVSRIPGPQYDNITVSMIEVI